jgi:hypothetical protein
MSKRIEVPYPTSRNQKEKLMRSSRRTNTPIAETNQRCCCINVWKLVIVASVTQEDLIHDELCCRPHILADVEWQLCVRVVYDCDHLI